MRIRREVGCVVQKVLLLAKEISPAPGGIARYAEQVAKEYGRAGFNVTLISTNAPADELTASQIIVGRQSQLLIGVTIFFQIALRNCDTSKTLGYCARHYLADGFTATSITSAASW